MTRPALALACAIAIACGCAAETHESAQTEPAVQPIESLALPWLREVRNAHALADRAASPDAQRQAAEQLAALARTEPPASRLPPEDAASVRQDLYGRAAQLFMSLGEPKRALELANEGLALPAGSSPFHSQLLLQTAELKTALGDAEGAQTARQEAVRMLGTGDAP